VDEGAIAVLHRRGAPLGVLKEARVQRGGLVRSLRIRTRRKFGNLGILTSALGDAGASIGEITTEKIGHSFTEREFQLALEDEDHLQAVCAAVNALADSEIIEVVNRVQEVHEGGKIATVSRVPLTGFRTLQTAIGPGVAEIVRLIDDDPRNADRFTSVSRTVALISDGTGLQGVGRVRSRAVLPVFEAKAALLAELGGLNSLPLVLDAPSEDDLLAAVQALSPSCGAILLDAVSGARAQRVTKKLEDALGIPILLDDADCPAVGALACVINACRRAGKDINTVRIGQLGLGTAGAAIASLVMRFTGRPVLGDDVHPASVGRHVANGGQASSLDEIMATCDVVVANTGHGGVIPANSVREGQAILALSEPRPEIEPYDAMLAGAAFAADGKVLNKGAVLPGMFLGALAVKARRFDDEMRIAAACTLAEVAPDNDLLPMPLDEGVHAAVASSVAKAAIRSGLALREVPESALAPSIFEEVIRRERSLPL
jgi:malate dehydrogenase (oxaloacetate-decarboxylating)